jgi:hypothetical protein
MADTKSQESNAIVPREQEFQNEALTLVDKAKSIQVSNQQEFEQAVDFGKGTSAFIKKVETFFKPLKQTAKAAHTALCEKEKEILKVPLEADAIVHATANKWKAEQKRIDDERLRIEQARLAKQAEEDRKNLLRLLKEAGDKEALKQAKATPVEIPKAEIQPGFQKVAGTRNRVNWHFEVTDKNAVPDQFWMLDERAIREYVGAMREKALPGGGFEISGVKVWSTEETDW